MIDPGMHDWEYCDLRQDPIDLFFKDNTWGPKQAEYDGSLTKTQTNQWCDDWGVRAGEYNPSTHPGELDANSYCRNPGGDRDTIWCYDRDNMDVEWEYCSVFDDTTEISSSSYGKY